MPAWLASTRALAWRASSAGSRGMRWWTRAKSRSTWLGLGLGSGLGLGLGVTLTLTLTLTHLRREVSLGVC